MPMFPPNLALIGKYAGAVKATNAAPALLSLPSRERVGVRVHRGAAFPPHPALSPSRGEGNGAEHTSRYFGTELTGGSSASLDSRSDRTPPLTLPSPPPGGEGTIWLPLPLRRRGNDTAPSAPRGEGSTRLPLPPSGARGSTRLPLPRRG